jgi:NAD-dependent DNA ligase
MSSSNLTLHAQPKDEQALAALRHFVACVKNRAFSEIEQMDTQEALSDIEEYFNTEIQASELDGIMRMKFETFTSFESEGFVQFLQDIGAADVEISVFDSQVGEFYFYKNEDCLSDYNEAEWNWLKNPQPQFDDEYVVVTGTFENRSREGIEVFIQDYGGTVQKTVNGKTTLLVIGKNPGASKVSKALALGIRTLSEGQMRDWLEH